MPVSGGSKVLLFQGLINQTVTEAYSGSGRVLPTNGPFFPTGGLIFPKPAQGASTIWAVQPAERLHWRPTGKGDSIRFRGVASWLEPHRETDQVIKRRHQNSSFEQHFARKRRSKTAAERYSNRSDEGGKRAS